MVTHAFIILALISAFSPEASSFSTRIRSLCSHISANKLSAQGGQGRQLKTTTTTTTALKASSNENTWRSAIIKNAADNEPDALEAIQDICTSTPCRSPNASQGEQGLAFLFVSQKYSDHFESMVKVAHQTLGDDTTLLSIVGGGVVGGGIESDDPSVPAASLLCGVLPPSAGIEVFMFGTDELPPSATSEAWKAIGRGQDVPSYVLFADGFAPIQQVLDGLDASGANGAVVAGGLSCPTFGVESPTVAINGKAYPRGAAVGVGFSGAVGLQTIVAQGCRPVGPSFSVTEASDNVIEELDNKPAVEILSTITGGDYLTDEDKRLVESGGLLCGLAARGDETGDGTVPKGDYLVRQIFGFRVPGFMIGGEVRKGDILRFHVRDKGAALDDIRTMIGKAKTERSFAGSQKAGVPLAAMQVSCVARGRPLFGSSGVDLANVGELVGGEDDDGEQPAVGGFFANGEIGPVGVAGVGLGSGKQTHIHAFTTIAATICNFSSLEGAVGSEGEGDVEDISAWG